ncbi:MAG: PEP-CTERM sorting domain-containing protein [Pirellulales bacterium]
MLRFVDGHCAARCDRTTWRRLGCATLLVAACIAAPANAWGANLLADSQADWAASDGAQGYNGWQYGYYDGSSLHPYKNNPAGDDFAAMTEFVNDAWWHQEGVGGYWTMVGPLLQHPNGTQENHAGRLAALEYAVRRWVSDFTGDITIAGHIAMGGGVQDNNGINGYIFIDGVKVYEQRVLSGNQTGFDFAIPTSILAGQTIDFAIDPGPLAAGDIYSDLFDNTKFSAQITERVPEPATISLAGVGIATVLLVGLRRRRNRLAG